MFDPVERDFDTGNGYDNSTAPAQNWLSADQISNTALSANMRRTHGVVRVREVSADRQVTAYEFWDGESVLAIGNDRAVWARTQCSEYETICIQRGLDY